MPHRILEKSCALSLLKGYRYSESEFTLNYFLSFIDTSSKVARGLERGVADIMYERFLREFMDVLIMVKIREGETSGYGILNYCHTKFDFLVSPGTVYAVLYTMERDGLIKAQGGDRKRVYTLTPKGEATIKAIQESSAVLESFFPNLLRGK